ncbi:MAG: 30S ribosomal protein S2 [Blastocatellales bacterium]|nr:30S ribosomal protein S2 [Blastocatellales bacterium]
MATVTMKELLEAGVHFGHQVRRWNPKMKEYIFGERNGIYIIDLQKTQRMFKEAIKFVTDLTSAGTNRTVLFVGTKRQAQDAIRDEALRCNQYFINQRWLGGLLTNFTTIQKSIKRLKEIEAMQADGRIDQFAKKERLQIDRERQALDKNLSGIKDMKRLPDIIFVIDTNKEEIAVKEANRLGIPVVAVVDTNCDPDGVNHVIPGNDDALRAVRLFASRIADAVLEGQQLAQQKESEEAAVAAETAATSGAAEPSRPRRERGERGERRDRGDRRDRRDRGDRGERGERRPRPAATTTPQAAPAVSTDAPTATAVAAAPPVPAPPVVETPEAPAPQVDATPAEAPAPESTETRVAEPVAAPAAASTEPSVPATGGAEETENAPDTAVETA